METRDIFKKSFKDDNGRVFRIVGDKKNFNVIIDGEPHFESDVPYKLVKGVKLIWGKYDCIQSCNGKELKIYFSNLEHKYIAMTGILKANLCIMN